ALVYVVLKDWEQRRGPGQHSLELVARANRELSALKEGVAFVFNPPAVMGLGTRAGFELQVQNRAGGDVRDLAKVTGDFMAAVRGRPEITGATVPLSVSLPQLSATVDRDRAKAMGVP